MKVTRGYLLNDTSFVFTDDLPNYHDALLKMRKTEEVSRDMAHLCFTEAGHSVKKISTTVESFSDFPPTPSIGDLVFCRENEFVWSYIGGQVWCQLFHLPGAVRG